MRRLKWVVALAAISVSALGSQAQAATTIGQTFVPDPANNAGRCQRLRSSSATASAHEAAPSRVIEPAQRTIIR